MLVSVILPASIYQVILTHSLSTEKEEIIGMLIGSWETMPCNNPYMKGRTTARIEAISLLTRSDKRKDRVEIAPEQLHLAALQAEEHSKRANRPMCVIGWYHSHPHITAFPSHVDLKTQYLQQSMDDRFFGMILSCFDATPDHENHIQLVCFQSEKQPDGSIRSTDIKIDIQKEDIFSAISRDSMMVLPKNMFEENQKEYHSTLHRTSRVYTNDSWEKQRSMRPLQMENFYNTSVYGQSVVNLVDTFIIPMKRTFELRRLAVEQEIALLMEEKDIRDNKKASKSLIDLYDENENVTQKEYLLASKYPVDDDDDDDSPKPKEVFIISESPSPEIIDMESLNKGLSLRTGDGSNHSPVNVEVFDVDLEDVEDDAHISEYAKQRRMRKEAVRRSKLKGLDILIDLS
ncbi:JAB1/Mov34/MPN/PAD-1 ubiquitin protease-domain-containing protein [Phycomyces nitens]|nr:JAB1/Mov34/MPN/PAD-1 ubiquitin protease-domain-containing protein [Phycomyces nitens]